MSAKRKLKTNKASKTSRTSKHSSKRARRARVGGRSLLHLAAVGFFVIIIFIGVGVHALASKTNGVDRDGTELTAASRYEHKNASNSVSSNGRTGAQQGVPGSDTKTGSSSSARPKTVATATPQTSTKSAASTPVTAPKTVAAAPASPSAGNGIVHGNIITTLFWVGEPADASNANITNVVSAWDEAWQTHYGGVDGPTSRNGFYPAAFTPHENPFYFALPYNDFDGNGNRKATAGYCLNANSGIGSWCKNTWIKISANGKTVYAQWEDVGPINEDDTAYVFGTAAPANTWDSKAGLDLSPATHDYLGLGDVSRTSWQFIPASAVPAGPWKQIVTTSLGT